MLSPFTVCRQKVMEGEIVIGDAVAQLTRLQVSANTWVGAGRGEPKHT